MFNNMEDIGMAWKGLEMKVIEDIQRLKKLNFTQRKIAKCLGIHRLTVRKYWIEEQTKNIDIKPKKVAEASHGWTTQVDWESVRAEKLMGTPISVLFEELKDRGVVPVSFSGFWKQLDRRAPLLETTMVRVFAPGSRAEIDYADGIKIFDPISGFFW